MTFKRKRSVKNCKVEVLCVDPGPTESGIVFYDGTTISGANSKINNNDLLILMLASAAKIMVIEGIASYGMAVGATTFETCEWIGRFRQKFGFENTYKIYRPEIKLHLCHSMRAKGTNVRQAVLDRFESTGGGKTPQIGTNKQPGPLYGVTSHAMSALALGITFFETAKLKNNK